MELRASVEPIDAIQTQVLPMFDGRVLTERRVEGFARGEMLTWGLCPDEARTDGTCQFWLTERKSNGALQTVFMNERTCSSTSLPCRDGYLMSSRFRSTASLDTAQEVVHSTQRYWVATQLRRRFGGIAYRERLVGRAEMSVGRNDYDLRIYDGAGTLQVDESASVHALTQPYQDACDFASEAGYFSAQVLAGALGTAAGLAAAAGSTATWFGAASVAIAGVVGSPAAAGAVVMIGVGVAAMGVVWVGLNVFCSEELPDPPEPPGGPGGRLPPGGYGDHDRGCPEGTYYGQTCHDCSTQEMTSDGGGEYTVTLTQRTCCVWGCWDF